MSAFPNNINQNSDAFRVIKNPLYPMGLPEGFSAPTNQISDLSYIDELALSLPKGAIDDLFLRNKLLSILDAEAVQGAAQSLCRDYLLHGTSALHSPEDSQQVLRFLTELQHPARALKCGLSFEHLELLHTAAKGIEQLESLPQLSQIPNVGESIRDSLIDEAGFSDAELTFRRRAQLVDANASELVSLTNGLFQMGVLYVGMSTAETAATVLAYVQDHFSYIQDGADDHWNTIAETLKQKGGDCEDLAMLTSSLLMQVLKHQGFSDDAVHHMVTVSSGYIATDEGPTKIGHTIVRFEDPSGETLALDATSKNKPLLFSDIPFDEVLRFNDKKFVQLQTIDPFFETAAQVNFRINLAEGTTFAASDSQINEAQKSILYSINKSAERLQEHASLKIKIPRLRHGNLYQAVSVEGYKPIIPQTILPNGDFTAQRANMPGATFGFLELLQSDFIPRTVDATKIYYDTLVDALYLKDSKQAMVNAGYSNTSGVYKTFNVITGKYNSLTGSEFTALPPDAVVYRSLLAYQEIGSGLGHISPSTFRRDLANVDSDGHAIDPTSNFIGGPDEFFNIRKVRVEINSAVDSFDMYTIQIKEERFFHYIEDIRQFVNKLTGLFLISASYLELLQIAAREIGDQSLNDEEKQAANARRQDEDKQHNKFAEIIGKWQDKMGQGVRDIEHELNNFIRATNESEAARVGFLVDMYPRKIDEAGKEDAGTIVANVFTGIGTDLTDEFTGAFTQAKSTAKFNLSIVQTSLSAFNAQAGLSITERISKHIDLWEAEPGHAETEEAITSNINNPLYFGRSTYDVQYGSSSFQALSKRTSRNAIIENIQFVKNTDLAQMLRIIEHKNNFSPAAAGAAGAIKLNLGANRTEIQQNAGTGPSHLFNEAPNVKNDAGAGADPVIPNLVTNVPTNNEPNVSMLAKVNNLKIKMETIQSQITNAATLNPPLTQAQIAVLQSDLLAADAKLDDTMGITKQRQAIVDTTKRLNAITADPTLPPGPNFYAPAIKYASIAEETADLTKILNGTPGGQPSLQKKLDDMLVSKAKHSVPPSEIQAADLLTKENLDKVNAQVSGQSPDIPAAAGGSERYFFDYNMPRQATMRRDLIQYQNFMRAALIAKQNLTGKIKEEAAKLGDSQGSGSETTLRRYASQALEADLSIQYGAFDNAMQETFQLSSLLNELATHQLEYFRATQMAAMKATKFALQLVVEGSSIAAGNALSPLSTLAFADPFYFSYLFNTVATQAVDTLGAGWEMGIDKATAEYYRPTIMQLSDTKFNTAYTNQKLNSQSIKTFDQATLDSKKTLDLFSQDSFQFFEHATDSLLLHTQNLFNPVVTRSFTKDGGTAMGNTYKDTVPIFIQDRHDGFYVTDGYEMYLREGPSRTSKDLSIPRSEAATNFEQPLWSYFAKIKMYMFVLYALYDAVETILGDMFGTQKSSNIQKFDGMIDSFVGYQRSLIGNFKQETSAFLQSTKQNAEKEKKIEFDIYDVASAGTKIAVAALSAFPNAGRVLVMSGNILADAAEMIRKRAAGTFAGTFAEYRDRSGSTKPAAPSILDATLVDYTSLDPVKNKQVLDLNVLQTTVTAFNDATLSDPLGKYAGYNPAKLTLPDPSKASAADRGVIAQDARRYLSWFELDQMESKVINEMYLKNQNDPYHPTALQYTTANFTDIIAAQTALNNIFTIRTIYMMIEQGLLNAKQQTIKDMFGHSISSNILSKTMSIVDQYNQSQLDSINSLTQEFSSRAEAHNKYEEEVMGLEVDSAAIPIGAVVFWLFTPTPNPTGGGGSKYANWEKKIVAGKTGKQAAQSLGNLTIGLVGIISGLQKKINPIKSEFLNYEVATQEDKDRDANIKEKTDEKDKLEKKQKSGTPLTDDEKKTLSKLKNDTGPGSLASMQTAKIRSTQKRQESDSTNINMGQDQLKFVGSGQMVVQRGAKNEASMKLTRKARQAEMIQQVRLSLADAFMDSSDEMSGSKSSRSYRGVIGIINRTKGVESSQIDLMEQALEAKANESNRAMNKIVSAAVSMIAQGIESLAAKKVAKAKSGDAREKRSLKVEKNKKNIKHLEKKQADKKAQGKKLSKSDAKDLKLLQTRTKKLEAKQEKSNAKAEAKEKKSGPKPVTKADKLRNHWLGARNEFKGGSKWAKVLHTIGRVAGGIGHMLYRLLTLPIYLINKAFTVIAKVLAWKEARNNKAAAKTMKKKEDKQDKKIKAKEGEIDAFKKDLRGGHLTEKEEKSKRKEIAKLESEITSMSASMENTKRTRISLETPKVSKEQSDEGSNPNVTEIQRNAKARDNMRSKRQWRVTGHMSQILANIIADGIISASSGSNMGLAGQANLAKITDGIDGDNVLAGNDGDMGIKDTADLENATLGMQLEKANSQSFTEVMRIQNRFNQAAARALRQHALDPLIKASLGMSRKDQETAIEQKKHELTDMIIRIQRRKQQAGNDNPTPVTRDDIIKEMGWKGAVAAGIMTGGIKYANAVSRFMFGNGKTYATIDTDLKDKASAKGDKSVESKLDEKINELEKMTSRTKEQDTTLVEYKNHKKLIEDVRTFEGKIRQSAEEKVKLAGQLRESGEDSSAVSNLVLSADEEKALPEMKIKLDAMNKDRKKEFGIEDASVSGWSKLGAYAKRTGFMNLLGYNVQIQSGNSVLANSKNDKQFQFAVQQLFLERRILESKIAYDEARSTDATYADQLLGQRRMRLQDAENVLTVGANLERMTEDLKGNATLEPVQKSFQELQDVTDRVLKLGTFSLDDMVKALDPDGTNPKSKEQAKEQAQTLFASLISAGYADKKGDSIMMTAKYYSRMSRHSDKNDDGTLVDPIDNLVKKAGFADPKIAKTLLTQFSGSTEALDSIYRARNDMETAAATLMSGMALSTTQAQANVSTFQKALKTLSPLDFGAHLVANQTLPSFVMTQDTNGELQKTPLKMGEEKSRVPILYVMPSGTGPETVEAIWVNEDINTTEEAFTKKLPPGARLFEAKNDQGLLTEQISNASAYDNAVTNVVVAMSESNQVSVSNVAALTKLTGFLNNFTNTAMSVGHAPGSFSAAQAISRSQGFNKALRAVNLATRTSMDARDDINRRLLNSGVDQQDIDKILEDLYNSGLINKTTGQATNLTPDNIKTAVSKGYGNTVKEVLQQSLTDQYQQRTIKDDIERRGGKTQAEYQSFLNLLDTSISLADTTYNAGGATPNTNEQNALTALKTVISAYGQKASDTAIDQKRFVMGVRTSNAQVFSYDDVKFDVFGSFGKGLTGAALERLDVVAPQNRRNLAIGRAQEELGINPARAVRSLRELYKEDYIRNEAGEILYNTDMAAMANKPSAANPPVLRFNVQKAFFEDVEKAASRIHGHMNTEGGAQIAAQIVMATIDNFSQAGKEYMEEETRNFLPHLLRIFQNEAPEDAEKLIAALIAQNQNNPRGLATVMDGISRAGQTDVQFFKGLVDQNKAQRFALSVLQLNLGGQTASMGLNPTEEAAMMMEQRGINVTKNAADFRQAIIKSENIVDIFAHTTAADLQQGGFAAIIKNEQDFVTVEEKLKAVASDKMAPDGKRFLANQALRNIYAARDKSPNTNDIDLFSGDTTLSPKEFGAIGQSGLFSKPLYGNKGVNENLEELANKLRDPKTRTQTVAALNASGGAGIRDLSILLSQANNSDVGAVRHESAGQKGFVAATAILDNLIDINSADSEAVLFKLAPVLAGPLRSSLPTQTVSKYLDQPNSQRTLDPDAARALDLTTRFKNDQASSQQFLNGVTTSNKEGVRSATPAFINELDNADDEKLRKFAALVAKSLATQSTTTGANGQDTLVGDELLATVAIPVLSEEQNKKFAGYLGEQLEEYNKHLTNGNKIDIDERIKKLEARTAHEHKDKADQFRDSLNHGMLSRRPQFLLGKDLKTGLADEAKKLANKPDSSADVAALNTFNRDMVLHGDRQAAAALITELLTVTTPEAKQHANAAKRLTRSVGQLTLNPTERQRASLEDYYTDVMKTTKGLIDNPDTADTIKEIHQHAQDQLNLLKAQATTTPGKATAATRLADDIRTNLFAPVPVLDDKGHKKLDTNGKEILAANPSDAAKSMVTKSFQALDGGLDPFSNIEASSKHAPESPQATALVAVAKYRTEYLNNQKRTDTTLEYLNNHVVGSVNTLTEGVDALDNRADRQWLRTMGDLALLSHEKDIDTSAQISGTDGKHARALQGPLKEAKARVMKTYLLNATPAQLRDFYADEANVKMLAVILPDIVLAREEKTIMVPGENIVDGIKTPVMIPDQHQTQTTLDKDGLAILTKLLTGTDYEDTRPLMPKILDLLDTPMEETDRTSLEPLVEKRLTQQLSTLSNTDTTKLNETAEQLLLFQKHQSGKAPELTNELKETLVKLLTQNIKLETNKAIRNLLPDTTTTKEALVAINDATSPSELSNAREKYKQALTANNPIDKAKIDKALGNVLQSMTDIHNLKDATSYKKLGRILNGITDTSLGKIKKHLDTVEAKETNFKKDQTLGNELKKLGGSINTKDPRIKEMMKDPKRMEAFKKGFGPQYLSILTNMSKDELTQLSTVQKDASATTVVAVDHPDLSRLLNGTNKDILDGYMNGDLSLFLAAKQQEDTPHELKPEKKTLALMIPLFNLDPERFTSLMQNVNSKAILSPDLTTLTDGNSAAGHSPVINAQGFIHPEFLLPDGTGLNTQGIHAVNMLLPDINQSSLAINELNSATSRVESREKLVETLQSEVRNSSAISSQEMQSSLQTLQKIKSKLQNRTQDAFGQLADMAKTAQKQAMGKDVQPYHETVAKMAGTLQNMQPELLKLGVSQDAIDKLKSNDPDTLQFEILDILKTARANAGGGEQIQLDKITQQLSTAVFAYALDPKVSERPAVKEGLKKFLPALSKDDKNPIVTLLKNSDSTELLDGILTLCKGKENEAMLTAVLPLCIKDGNIAQKTPQLMDLLTSKHQDVGIAILNTLSPDKQVDILNLLYSGTNPDGSARDIVALLPKTTDALGSPIPLSSLPFSDLHEEGLSRLLPVLNKMELATAKNIIPQLKIMTDPNLEPYANQMSLLLSSELQTPAGLTRITELEVTSKLMKKATTNPAQFQTDLADKILKTPIESDFSSTFSMLMSDQASQQQIISLMNANPAVRDRLVSLVTSDQSGTMISSRTLNSMMQSTQFKAAVTKNIGSNKDVSGERADLLYHALRLSSAKGIRQKESMTFESSPDKGKATIGKMMQLSLQDGKTSDLRNFFLRDTETKNMVLDHIADGLAGTPGAILSKQQAMKALNVLYTPEMAVGALEKGFKAQYALATNPQEKNAAIDSFLKETLQNPDFLSSLPPAQRNNMMGQVMRSVTAWVGTAVLSKKLEDLSALPGSITATNLKSIIADESEQKHTLDALVDQKILIENLPKGSGSYSFTKEYEITKKLNSFGPSSVITPKSFSAIFSRKFEQEQAVALLVEQKILSENPPKGSGSYSLSQNYVKGPQLSFDLGIRVGKNDAGIKATLDGLANVANDPNHTAPEHVREQAKEITLQFKDETEKAQFSNAEQTLEIEYANATDATEKNAAIDKFLKASQAFLASASPDNVNDRIDHVFDNISDLTKEPSLKIAVINSFIQQTILDKDFLKNMPDDNRNKLIEKVLNNITTLLEDPHAAKTMLTYLSTQTNAAPHVATHAKSLLQSGAAAPTASTLLADLQNTPEFMTKWASDPAYRETMLKEMTEGLKASPPDPMILALASPGIDGTRPLDSLLNDTYPSPKERAARQRFLDKLYEAKTKDASLSIKKKAEFAMWIGKHQPGGSISATQFVDSKKGLTLEQSQDIHTTLKDNGFLDASGRVTRMLDSTTVSEIKDLFATSLSPDQIQGVLSTLTMASSGSPASQTSFLVNDLLPKFDPSYKAHNKGYTKQLTAACQSVMDSKDLSDQQKLEWLKVLSKQGNEKHETAALKALHTYTNKMASTAVTKEEKAAAAAQKAIFTELLAFSLNSQPSVYLTQAFNQISPMGQLLKTIVENDLNDPANPGSVVFGLTSALQKTPYAMFVIDTALEYVYLSKNTFSDNREHYRGVFKTMLRKAAVENNVGVMNVLHVMGSHLAYQGQSVTFLHEVLAEANTFTPGELLGASDLIGTSDPAKPLQERATDAANRATKASDFLLKRLAAHDNGFLTYDKASKTYIRTDKELTSPDELKLDDFFRNKDFFPTPPTKADRTRILNTMVNELSAGPRLISSMVTAAKTEPDYQLLRSHKESMPDAANALDPKKALPLAKEPQSFRKEHHSINNFLLDQGPAGAALKTVMDARVKTESDPALHNRLLTTDLLSTPASQISSELMAGTTVLRDSDFTSTGTLEKLISTGYIDSNTGRVTAKFKPDGTGPLPGLEGEFMGQHQAIRDTLTQAAGRQADASQRSQEILKALIPANAEKLYKSINDLAPDSQLYRQLAVTGHALVKELASQADALAAEKNNATDPVKLRHIASQEETLKSHLETLYIAAPSMFMGALKTTGSSQASVRTLMGMKDADSITQTLGKVQTAAVSVKTIDPKSKRPDNPILEAFKNPKAPITNPQSPKEFALALRATDALPENNNAFLKNFKAALEKQQKQDGLASKSEAFIRFFGFQDADRQEVADALRILKFTAKDKTGKEHPESMAKDIQTLHETLPVFAGEGTVTVNKGAMQHAMGLTGEDAVADRVLNAMEATEMVTLSGNDIEIPSKPFTKTQWDALNAHLKSKDPLNTLQLSDKKTDFLLSDAKKAFESRQENLDSTKILSAVQTLYVDEKGNLTKAKLKKDFPVFETNPDKLETLKFDLAVQGLTSNNQDIKANSVMTLLTPSFRDLMETRQKDQPNIRTDLEAAMQSTTGLARKDITTLKPKPTGVPTPVKLAFDKFDAAPNKTLSDLRELVIGLQTGPRMTLSKDDKALLIQERFNTIPTYVDGNAGIHAIFGKQGTGTYTQDAALVRGIRQEYVDHLNTVLRSPTDAEIIKKANILLGTTGTAKALTDVTTAKQTITGAINRVAASTDSALNAGDLTVIAALKNESIVIHQIQNGELQTIRKNEVAGKEPIHILLGEINVGTQKANHFERLESQ